MSRYPSVEVVLGRKFCAGCGHWRHLCDYGQHRGGHRARCRVCHLRYQIAWRDRMTPEQRAHRREYERFWYEAKRREAGLPTGSTRRQRRALPIERVFFPTEPLLEVLNDAVRRELVESWEVIARRAGLDGHTIRRLRFGESERVRIDTADRLAHALGLPLALVYPDEYGQAS